MVLILAVLVAVGVLVPIHFTVSVPGHIEPVQTIRVTAAESGRALEVRKPGPVQEGDCLFRLDDESDQRRLRDVQAQVAALRERLALETRILADQKSAWSLELAVVRAERDGVAEQLRQAQGKTRELAAQVKAKSLAQGEVDAELAESEYGILRKLAAELSVPAMELAQGKARASKATLQVEEAKLAEKQRVLAEENQIERLRQQLRGCDAREKQILGRTQDERPMAEVNYRILQLEAEAAELSSVIRHKVCIAPSAGEWGGLGFVPGEYVTQGALVGVVRAGDGLLFVGQAAGSDFAWLKPGAVAHLRLQAYPFMKYGSLPGRLAEMEAYTEGEVPSFVVRLAVDAKEARFLPSSGLVGEARIVVFHGSLLNYLLAEPPTVRRPRLHPVADGNRFTEWLKRLDGSSPEGE
jgi:hemolysin D